MCNVRVSLFVISWCISSHAICVLSPSRSCNVCAYRQQRSASSKGSSAAAAPAVNGAAPKQAQEVVVAYASQTGTAQEIARNIQAESSKHGIQSKVPHLLRIAVHELHNTNMLPVIAQTGHSTQMLFCKKRFSSCSCLILAYTSGAYGACHKFLVASHSPSRTTCIRDVVGVAKHVKQMYTYMMHACRFCHSMSWVWRA